MRPSSGLAERGRVALVFAAIVPSEEMPTAALMIPLSRSLAKRIANIVEHCERAVGSSSEGRWVMTPREAPYLRPSLAIRPIAWRVGRNPCAESAGM